MATQDKGHAAIQFPDGSYLKMSPSTTVQIQQVRAPEDEDQPQSAELIQKTGRTLANVQHLVGGATFKVGGHAVSASVRGTEFECWCARTTRT